MRFGSWTRLAVIMLLLSQAAGFGHWLHVAVAHSSPVSAHADDEYGCTFHDHHAQHDVPCDESAPKTNSHTDSSDCPICQQFLLTGAISNAAPALLASAPITVDVRARVDDIIVESRPAGMAGARAPPSLRLG